MKLNRKNLFLTSVLFTIAVAGAFVPVQANAQNLFYRSTTAANTWTGSFWGTSDAGPFTSAWVSGRPAVFADNGGTALALTGATTNFSSITANESVNVTAGGTLGTGGTVASITVAAGKNMNFGTQAFSTAAGTGFIKNGDGILTLAGGTYTGGFTVNAGTVALSGVNGMGAGGALTINGGTISSNSTAARDLTGKYTGGITVGGNFTLGDSTNNGALTFTNTVNLGAANRTITANSAATFGAAAVFSGGVGVGFTKNGAGTLRLNGVNTLTGVVEVSGGVLQIGSYTGLSTASSLTVSGGGTSNLQLVQVGTGATTNSINKALSLHGTVSIAGGSVTNTLAQTMVGNITLAGSSTITNNGNSRFDIDGNIILGAHTLTYAADGTGSRIDGIISGAGSLVKSSAQDLTLSNSNSYTGTTSITGGVLNLTNANALGTTPGTNGTSGISISAGAVLASATGGTNPSTTIAAPITLVAGGNTTLRIGQGAASNTHTFNIDGAISGATTNLVFTTATASFNNGSSVFDLGAAGTYTGDTIITTGNGANNPVTVRAGTGIVNALPSTTVLSFGQIAGAGSGRSLAYELNGNNQTLAGLNNALAVPADRNIRVNSTAAATLTINNTVDFTFGGVTLEAGGTTTSAQITGAIALTKSGTGTFTLGGVVTGGAAIQGNAFTGDTKILGGILVLGESLSIRNSAFDTAGSIAGDPTNGLRSSVTALTLGGLTGGNDFATRFTSTTGGYTGLTALTLNPGTGVTNSYSGDVGNGAGAMTLTKTGAGTQTLTVAQTYSGGTFVTAGTLALSGTGTLGASGTALTLSGGSLDLGTLSQTVGAVSVTTAAASGDTISNGNLTGTSYAASNASGTAVISANLLANGAAGFDKTGAGTATLSGTNTYTGNTTITAGVLGTALATNLAGFTDSGKVVFNGGRLNIGTGDGTTTGWSAAQVATLLSNATKTSGTLDVTVANGDVIETAFDFGGLNLVKSGASTLTLNQAHTLGATTINDGGGTLRITDAGALGAGAVSILTAGLSTGTLELALTGTNSIANTFNGFNSASSLTGTGNAQILNTSGTNTIASDLTVTNTGGNGLNVVSNGGLLTLSGTISHTVASGRTLSLGGGGNGVVSGAINNNTVDSQITIVNKSGTGTWTLSGNSGYTGSTTVTEGSLIINGAVASTSVVVNASLGGSGTASAATLSGTGSINPGNSPGIFTAAAANPTGGLDFNFEFTAANADPTWSNATASVNDVLRLTNATPFTASLGVSNTVNIYLNVASFLENDVFTGGFYTDNSAAFLASISSADFQYFIADPAGTDYNGVNYSLYGGPLDFSVNTIQIASADFVGGTITNGFVTQFTVIPEPSVAALIGAFGGILLLRRRR